MSRVLVTGASGYLAMHVVKQLVDSGEYIVRGTVRSLTNETKVKPLKELSSENDKYQQIPTRIGGGRSYKERNLGRVSNIVLNSHPIPL